MINNRTHFSVRLLRIVLLGTALTPLIVGRGIFFPFISGKIFFFRALVEIALAVFAIHLIVDPEPLSKLNQIRNHPIVKILFFFLISSFLSILFAVNSYRAFWGDLERGDGVFGLIHYLIFLALAAAFFEKKHWHQFFKISLLVNIFISVFAVSEYLKTGERITSFLGNPAFFGAYSIFILVFAAIIFFNDSKWRLWSILSGALALISLFLSNTRGAILGFGFGFLFLVFYLLLKRKKEIRLSRFLVKPKIFLLALIILFSLIFLFFWATRSQSFWQGIPGLNRIVQLLSLGPKDSSVQTRLITWQVSMKALQEKPILGWGPENFIVAYQKYYDPKYVDYGETWFDKAHNKILDILVTQGAIGVIAYLGIFLVIFHLLFKKSGSQIKASPFISAGLIAYFSQNLFLFDHPVSYLYFFAIQGFIVANTIEDKDKKETERPNNFTDPLVIIFSSLLIIAAAYSLYRFNLTPYLQNRYWYASAKENYIERILEKLEKATKPYNFSQLNIIGQGIDSVYLGQYFSNPEYLKNPKFKALGEYLINLVDVFNRKEPYNVRMLLREVEMIHPFAKEDIETYKKGEALLKKALSLSPERQEVYYDLAFNLAKQKRFEEAKAIAEKSISLNPKIGRSYLNLALVNFFAGDKKQTLAELALVEKIDPDFFSLHSEDINNLAFIYGSLEEYDKLANIVKADMNKLSPYLREGYYNVVLSYYAVIENQADFIELAKHQKRQDLVSLAENNLWPVIREKIRDEIKLKSSQLNQLK